MGAPYPPDAGKRAFSEKRHETRAWRTTISGTGNALLRSLWNFCSFKRSGVNTLALKTEHGARVLDLGAGNGAYARWFLGRKPDATVIAADWSFTALRDTLPPKKGRLYRVCADIQYLPFKPELFDALFSVDTLGHVTDADRVLNEALRVLKNGARLFIHSECADYRRRRPDSALIRRNKSDLPAEIDGHFSLLPSGELHARYRRRFIIRYFFSPAGILGWMIGYPEKYHAAFKKARMPLCAGLTAVFALVKKTPVLGALLRVCNALTNRLELFLGLYGGGSCFAFMEKHDTVAQ